jgi:truncated hemoglobin YjbI
LLLAIAVESLLERLGGRDAIEVLVVGLWERIAQDPRLSTFFVDVSRPEYEQLLADYLYLLLGDRRALWRGPELRGEDFDLFAGCVASTLEAAGVSRPLIDETAARLETMRGEVV